MLNFIPPVPLCILLKGLLKKNTIMREAPVLFLWAGTPEDENVTASNTSPWPCPNRKCLICKCWQGPKMKQMAVSGVSWAGSRTRSTLTKYV